MAEPLGHDADDGHRVVVQPYRLADGRPIAAEAPLPQIIGDQGDVADPAAGIVGGEVPAHHRRHPEDREEVGRDHRRRDPLGLPVAGQVDIDRPGTGRILERVHLAAVIVQLGRGHRHVGHAARTEAGAQRHQPAGIGIGQRPEQHRVHHAEDRRVGADAQGKREHRDYGEPRAPSQAAEREPEIPPEGVHHATSLSRGAPGTKRPSNR
jgi:hypothetical protein